jgi:hypothetical protein
VIIAIQQPNYLPWMGYFHKIAQSDIFVFLDDVPFSKGSYTNRVKVLGTGVARWLSVPVKVKLGDKINEIKPANPGWLESHISSLKNYYSNAGEFAAAWPKLDEMFSCLPKGNLSEINQLLVKSIAGELGLSCKFVMSSDYEQGALTGDDRLISLLEQLAPKATYLSGKGAHKYQDPEKFHLAELGFNYTSFNPPQYPQMSEEFIPGLSIIDLILNVGWKQAGDLVCQP